MSSEPPGRFLRVEYLDFRSVAEHREFRLRAFGLDGSTEYRFRIPNAAFGRGGLRLQDGPDVCYQQLLRAVAAGETTGLDVITIDDADLARYRETHTQAPKHRSWADASPPMPPPVPKPGPPLPVATAIEPGLAKGQRVSHAVFGVGVTTSSKRGRTVVCFDQDGPKTFVTSMLKLDVLSAPHTWETSPRGNNRPCRGAPV